MNYYCFYLQIRYHSKWLTEVRNELQRSSDEGQDDQLQHIYYMQSVAYVKKVSF